jgi:hypothetical protein
MTKDRIKNPGLTAVYFALAVGFILIAVLAVCTRSIQNLVVLAALSGAALGLGAVAGFLFGIPKSRRDPSARETEGSSKDASSREGSPKDGQQAQGRRYSRNANLEDVSDWLTKILVGVGLIELTRIKEGLEKLAGSIAPALQLPLPAASAIVELAPIYFIVVGFFGAHLYTIFTIYELLSGVDTEQIKNDIISELEPDFKQKVRLSNLYVLIELERKKPLNERPSKALKDAYTEVTEEYRKDPANRTAAILTARYVSEIERDHQSSEASRAAIAQLDIFIRTREQFNRLDTDYADVLYNRAAYEACLIKPEISAEEAQTNRARALADLRKSVALNPANAREAKDDPDFTSLKDDPQFHAITGR